MYDDSIIIGESYIPKIKKIREMYLIPTNIDATPAAAEAIMDADIIVLGPGSLYTTLFQICCQKAYRRSLHRTELKYMYQIFLSSPGKLWERQPMIIYMPLKNI